MEIFSIGILLVIGVILVLIEILFIPGTTIFGILGLISIIVSNYLTFDFYGSEIGIIYTSTTSLIIFSSILYSLKSNSWSRLALNKTNTTKINQYKNKNLKIGDIGLTMSSLKPYGKASFSNVNYEVKSKGNFIDEKNKIKIIDIFEGKIIVIKIK
jgi:membrane-bound ClpP family serine protease